jgi:hypothetical protein
MSLRRSGRKTPLKWTCGKQAAAGALLMRSLFANFTKDKCFRTEMCVLLTHTPLPQGAQQPSLMLAFLRNQWI